MNIVELKEMKGYWKEMNDANEVISICKKNDKFENDGICYFYSNGIIDRISEWKNGKEISDSGYCRIYDEPNHVFFEGHFENGKREGKGKEYDEKGKVVFEGLYRNGKRTNMVVVKEMKGYWKEMNEDNEVISICKKNESNQNDGICYFYSNGTIDHISEWKNGEELNVLKRFEGNKMIEFVNGVKRYEGEFRNSIKHNYPREGEGEEYDSDGSRLLYHGHYWNGIRQGKGMGYRNGDVVYDGIWLIGFELNRILWVSMIVMIASIIISFVCFWWVGLIILVVDIIFCIIVGVNYNSIFDHNRNRKNGKVKKVQMKSDLKDNKQLNHLVIWIFVVNIFNIIFICVLLSLILPRKIQALCIGKDKILIEIIRTCGDWENEESFDIYEGYSRTDSLFHQETCSAMTANLCINPVVHTIVMKDSYGDGWSGGSRVTLRYKDQSYSYSGPSRSSRSETFHFVGFSYFLLVVV